MDYVLSVRSEKLLPHQRYLGFLLHSFLGVLSFLHFTFRTIIRFELIFMKGVGLCLDSLVLLVTVHALQNHLLKRLSLLHDVASAQINGSVFMRSVSRLPILFHGSMGLFPHQHHMD